VTEVTDRHRARLDITTIKSQTGPRFFTPRIASCWMLRCYAGSLNPTIAQEKRERETEKTSVDVVPKTAGF